MISQRFIDSYIHMYILCCSHRYVMLTAITFQCCCFAVIIVVVFIVIAVAAAAAATTALLLF